ncbi:hypothetical protein Droror1_Dr00026539 [Drosera rotundifolia]
MISKRGTAHASLNGVRSRILKTISFRGCFRFIRSHLLLITMIIFLAHMYRSYPWVLSVVISASPVVICSAVLLGVLLTFGQNNGQATENDRKLSNDFPSLKTRMFDQTSISQKDWNQSKSRFSEVRNEIIEKEIKEFQPGLTGYDVGKGKEHDRRPNISVPVNVGNSREAQFEKQPSERANGGKVEEVKGSVVVEKANSVYSSSSEHEKLADDDDHKSTDSEPDVAYKSPIDVSVVADMTPILDEVDPLLALEDPHYADQKGQADGGDGSGGEDDNEEMMDSNCDEDKEEEEEDDEVCKKSTGSKPVLTWTEDDQKNLIGLNSSELERDECLENLLARRTHGNDHENSAESDDEEEEEEEEEETPRVEEEDVTRHVVTWTEDDEKNLKHVGSSDLERDQRLENLIARRRVWRNFSVIPDINLIDLDSADRPFQVPPVSTSRLNPFDIPEQSDNQSGMPAIPGSAPSAGLPRENPFDYPDEFPEVHPEVVPTVVQESLEVFGKENFDFVGDSLAMNQNDAFFLRHQSFSRGRNFLVENLNDEPYEMNAKDASFRRYQSFGVGSSRHENRDFPPLRPYFMPDHSAVADDIGHQNFHKQSSEASDDSTASSASETESTPLSHKDIELIHQETEALPEINADHHIELGSQSSYVDEGRDWDHAESSRDTEGSHEAGSQSSEGENLARRNSSEGENLVSVADEMNAKMEGNDVKGSGESSSVYLSDSSEASESVKEGDGFQDMEQERDNVVEDPNKSFTEGAEHSTESGHVSQGAEHCHEEPVYDTSPSGADKNNSFPTIPVQL